MPHQETTKGRDRRRSQAHLSMLMALSITFATSQGCANQPRRESSQDLTRPPAATASMVSPGRRDTARGRQMLPKARSKRPPATSPPAGTALAPQPGASLPSPAQTAPSRHKTVAQAPPNRAKHTRHQEGSFRFSVAELNCQGCRMSLKQMLRKYKGVSRVHLTQSAEMCIHFAKRMTSPQKIMGRATRTPIVCLYEKAQQARAIRWPKGADVKIITGPKRSKKVIFHKHLARGKVTIFDFYADWCGPCKSLDRWMRRLIRTNKKLAIRKVNVDHWGEAIARRFLKRCGGLPYLIIYNRKGKRSSILKGFDPVELHKAIAKAM